MRFRFEHGGRSGIRDPEAMGHALEQYHQDGGRFGSLLVDFADTNDQPGELFLATHVLLHEITVAIGEAIEMGRPDRSLHGPDLPAMWARLGQRLWAEGEVMLLARTAPPKRRRRGRSGTL